MRNQLLTGYILHQKPYGESRSLIYLFSEEWGVVHGIGKKNLPLFVPVQFFGNGKNSLKTFSQSQILQNHITLTGQSLYAGMYLNEILQKLLPVEEPFAEIWQAYQQCVANMANLFVEPAQSPHYMTRLKWHLRRFENVLFEQLGYGFDFAKDALGDLIAPSQRYQYQLQQGFMPVLPLDKPDISLTGEQLLTWYQCLQDEASFNQMMQQDFDLAKQLVNSISAMHRHLIDNLLNYQTLQSRELWQQLTQYQ
ncbi:recombination protein O N-terminal domain-containing protein [Moraxella osloensis]|nr:recombination protein O N-terminal domain-containing protein [Moraxella osloensis]MDK1670799.1 recombination protein O N-terminal domain-containing protein [Moraxella osloensis]